MNSLQRVIKENQIIAVLLLVVAGWFLLLIKEVVVALFIAFILMAALHPLVKLFMQLRLPKALAVALTYVIVLSVLIVLVLPLVPFFTQQISDLLTRFPRFLNTSAQLLGFQIQVEQINEIISSEVGTISRNAFQFTTRVFGGFFSILATIVISFYLLLDRDRVIREITELFPARMQKKVDTTIKLTEGKLGLWLRGQLILSLFVGLITYISLTLIGLEYALPLAVLAALLEIIPTIGPIIAAVPAVIVALSVSGIMALYVAIIYIFIQIIENNVLVPRIMQKAVGLNPIVVIIGIIAGGKLLGVVGALLSVPFITMVVVIYNSLRNHDV